MICASSGYRAAQIPWLAGTDVELRGRAPGDMGWLLMRQAEMYAQEFGYGPVFETYVAAGIPAFLEREDAHLDRVWIAWQGGRRVGAIAIQHDPERPGWAKLRWYLVEKEARGQGLGRRLVDEALAFCRQAGYVAIYLWTCSDLDAARRQYERVGFRLVEEAECPWKPSVAQQKWELALC